MGNTFCKKRMRRSSFVFCKPISHSLCLHYRERWLHVMSVFYGQPLIDWPYYWPMGKSHDSEWSHDLSGLTWTLRPGWDHIWLCLTPKPRFLTVSTLRKPASIPYLRWASLLFVFFQKPWALHQWNRKPMGTVECRRQVLCQPLVSVSLSTKDQAGHPYPSWLGSEATFLELLFP